MAGEGLPPVPGPAAGTRAAALDAGAADPAAEAEHGCSAGPAAGGQPGEGEQRQQEKQRGQQQPSEGGVQTRARASAPNLHIKLLFPFRKRLLKHRIG